MTKLDLGSGGRKIAGYLSVDNDPATLPHVLHNIEERFPFDNSTVDEVRAHHILEHIRTEKKTFVMYEIWRVLKPGGPVSIEIPLFPYPQSVMDPTHISFWVRESFWYYEHGNRFRDAFDRRTSYPVPSFRVIWESRVDSDPEHVEWLLKLKLGAVK